MTRENFIETYCRWVLQQDGFYYLSLKEKSDYDCILWKNGGCTAYEYRPLQCSAFPFWNILLSDKDMWNAAAKDCPGMGKGRLHSFEEIMDKLEKQKNEPCIRKKLN